MEGETPSPQGPSTAKLLRRNLLALPGWLRRNHEDEILDNLEPKAFV